MLMYGAFLLALNVVAMYIERVAGGNTSWVPYFVISSCIVALLIVSTYFDDGQGKGPEREWYYGDKSGIPSEGTDTEEWEDCRD